MPQVNPEIMVWARETAGLTQEEAAPKLGFRDSNVSSAAEKLAGVEEGQREPTRPQLVKMAEQYRRPLLTFYLSKPPARGDRGADFRTLSPERSSRDDALLDALVRDIRARQGMVRALLEDEEETEPLAFIGSHRIEDGPVAILASLRALLGVDLETYRAQSSASDAFRLLRESAERAGIFVLVKGDLGNYRTAIDTGIFRGFSVTDDLAPFVVINDQDARPAWSFTLLHETVHLLLGQSALSGDYGEDEVEQFCDGVAGEFLLPPEELDRLTFDNSSDLEEVSGRIADFADQRNLSHSMVAYNAYRSYRINRQTFGELHTAFRQRWRMGRERARASEREGGPNFYTVRRHRLGKRITDLVQRTMADGALSTPKAARILGVKSRQVQPLLEVGRSL